MVRHSQEGKAGRGVESWLSKARYSFSLEVQVSKKQIFSCMLHGCGEAKGLAQSRVMVGTPEIRVTTGRLRQFSPGPWAGLWGRGKDRRKSPPPTRRPSLNKPTVARRLAGNPHLPSCFEALPGPLEVEASHEQLTVPFSFHLPLAVGPQRGRTVAFLWARIAHSRVRGRHGAPALELRASAPQGRTLPCLSSPEAAAVPLLVCPPPRQDPLGGTEPQADVQLASPFLTQGGQLTCNWGAVMLVFMPS